MKDEMDSNQNEAILSSAYEDEGEIVVTSLEGCTEDLPIPCLIDEYDPDFKNGVTASVSKTIENHVLISDDIEIIYGEP